MNVTFCLVQRLIQYIQLPEKRWTFRNYDWVTASSFVFGKKYLDMKGSNTRMPLFSINRHFLTQT